MIETLLISYPDQAEFKAYHLKPATHGDLRICNWAGKITSYKVRDASIDAQFASGLSEAPHKHIASETQHCAMVDRCVASILTGAADKVVLSRIKRISSKSIDIQIALARLRSALPQACVFYLHTAAHGAWLCASPELLLEKKAGQYMTMALAGTRAWNGSLDYVWSEKDSQEQDVVTQYITDLCDQNGWPYELSDRYTRRAGTLAHLCTDISIHTDLEIQKVLSALHPTPAICGTPRESAKSMIDDLEAHDRDLYCGYLHMDHGDRSAAYVILRCAAIYSDAVDIYVGGGINRMSISQDEWQETELKSRSIMAALEE